MAGTPITFRAAAQRFACGDEFKNLQVINFTGPGGRVSAYCCNMNVDMDGDPQAYAPFGKAGFQPLDYLENAGWKPKSKNEEIKTKYEAKKKELGELEAKRKAATTSTPPHPAGGAPAGTPPPPPVSSATPAGAKPATPPVDLKALDKQIHDLQAEIHKLNPYPSSAKNYEKVFWHWYGVAAFKPGDEKHEVYTEKLGTGGKTKQRNPQLDSTADADVYGKLPVVQSEFEPGPGYYVSVLPRVVNTNFKAWDQRSFLPPDATAQRSYGAVSTVLTAATALDLNDNVWALRLDDSTTTEFPFLDRGFQPKVAECSIAAFFDMGGETKTVPGRTRPVYVNNFLILYVAFAGGGGAGRRAGGVRQGAQRRRVPAGAVVPGAADDRRRAGHRQRRPAGELPGVEEDEAGAAEEACGVRHRARRAGGGGVQGARGGTGVGAGKFRDAGNAVSAPRLPIGYRRQESGS